MNIKLMGYQQKLVNNIINTLDTKGKAGLELFTSGGKSFIGISIIEHYLRENKKILWIAPKAALNNVKTRYLDSLEYASSIECISMNVLSRLKDILEDESQYKQVSLIVIDEAHRIMARNAYQKFQEEIEKFGDVKLLAMTASSYRNLDGIKSLEELAGANNVFRYSLNEAIDAGIANPVVYYGTALEYNKDCYQALDKLREKYGKIPYIQQLLNIIVSKLRDTEADTITKVSSFIKKRAKFNAKNGDRHIIFFSRVAELKEQIPMVEQIMHKIYGNKIRVNIIEYHGDLTKQQNTEAIEIINGNPIPNQVDVILTVDKGAESLHPENIRSIILFRSTKSMVKFTQMIGRVITLTEQLNQTNYVFDFCSSISFVGAETIMIGHRGLDERVENSLDMTPEQLLVDALGIKKQTTNSNFIEVNLDEALEELNELFDRLSTIHKMLDDFKDIRRVVNKNANEVETTYNRNVAKYLYKNNRILYNSYRKIQNAVLYSDLTMGDGEAIKQAVDNSIGYRIFYTAKMTESQEKILRNLYIVSRGITAGDYSKIIEEPKKYEYLKQVAKQLLTDSLPVSIEEYIKQSPGMYSYLIKMFNCLTAQDLGCIDNHKETLAKQLISDISETYKKPLYNDWLKWKAKLSYIRYAKTNLDSELDNSKYAIAITKYISSLKSGKYLYSHKLCERDNNIGGKVLRLIEYIHKNDISNMLPLDENFALELIYGKYDSNDYVKEIISVAGFETVESFSSYLRFRIPSFEMFNKFSSEPTEDSLVKLINYGISRGIPSDIQQGILESEEAKTVFKNVGKDGSTALTKYCISKLNGNNEMIKETIKKAARNGLGYDKIILLAFPTEGITQAQLLLESMRDDSYTLEDIEVVKNKYCKMPYATSSILLNIKNNILPKKGYAVEKQFISELQ